jgi:hypothetical protein
MQIVVGQRTSNNAKRVHSKAENVGGAPAPSKKIAKLKYASQNAPHRVQRRRGLPYHAQRDCGSPSHARRFASGYS